MKSRHLAALILAALPLAAPLVADYPIVSHRYLADPSTLVHGGRVYVFCSNDDENPVGGNYEMKSLVCVSSSDMKNWTDHGVVFRVPDNAAWAAHSWAPAVVERGGVFYLYFSNNASGIGVASSTSPIGPYTDARGSVLINSATPGVLPATNIWIFDPGVFIDDDGQAYCYFGGNGESNVRIIRLNEDMISTSGSAERLTAPGFFEAAFMHKRDGIYYLSYSTNTANGLRIDYLTGNTAIGPFTYRGVVAGQPPNNNNNNHAAIFELNGAWYHVYHNRIVAMQAGVPPVYKRNIALERLHYNPDGTIQQITYTTDGVPQAHPLDPYARVEGETINAQSGITTEPCSEGGMNVTSISHGDWIRVRGVDFGALGAVSFTARVASATAGGTIELRLGSPTGTLIGSCTVAGTGGWQTWVDATCDISGATGVQDLHLVFTGGDGALMNLDWWRFTAARPPEILGQPRDLTLAPGGRLSLWVEVAGTVPLEYRWMKDGQTIADAASRFFEIAAAAPGDAGDYSVEVTNAYGTVVSEAAGVVVADAAPARITNLSVRAPLAADAVLIPGFVLHGASPREVLVRAVGPALAEFGVAGVLPDPALIMHAGDEPFLSNDDWGAAPDVPALIAATDDLGAFPLETGSADAAALVQLTPAPYTTHVYDIDGEPGVVLFELYEGAGADSRLVNISARGDASSGENVMILGFAVSGTSAKTLLIRAVGPGLAEFGVADHLADPVLALYQGGAAILSSDDWSEAPDLVAFAAVADEVGAFPLEAGSADAAVIVSLMPGTYTAIASGKAGAAGNVLVEVYEVP